VWHDEEPQAVPLACRENKKVQPIGKQQLLTSDGELQVPLFLDRMVEWSNRCTTPSFSTCGCAMKSCACIDLSTIP
jgi:hypothetical protein